MNQSEKKGFNLTDKEKERLFELMEGKLSPELSNELVDLVSGDYDPFPLWKDVIKKLEKKDSEK